MANGSDFQLQLQCPQCGAEVILHETDRVFWCAYCRVRLYLPYRIPFNCYFPARAVLQAHEGLFYLPYWRFRGVSYALRGTQVMHRILDTSVWGYPLKGAPYSLGMRPQALKLHFLTPDTPGRFIRPSLDLDAFLQRLENTLPAGSAGEQHPLFAHSFLGQTVTLIYTPFRWSNDCIYDALTERPLMCDEVSWESMDSLEQMSREGLTFWPTLCPECGYDLEAHKDSVVLFCPVCRCAWEAGNTGFEKVEICCLGSDKRPHTWLPFWQMEATLAGIPLNTLADFIRLTDLPRIIKPEMGEKPFTFWIPAFKLNPHLFLRVSRQMTISQQGTQEDRWPEFGERHPSCLPAGEAFRIVPILLGDLTPARETLFPLMRDLKPTLKTRRLAFVPFQQQGMELIQPRLGFSLPHAALRFGRSL